MNKIKEHLKCERGATIVTYLLGLCFVAVITAAVIGGVNTSLTSFHNAGVQYIQDLGSSGI